jgi:hypothetical protein
MKLLRVENGLCRAYYRDGDRLLCYQEAVRGKYDLFLCTKDGEPSHPIVLHQVPESEVPTGSDYTSTHLAEWLKQQGLIDYEGART